MKPNQDRILLLNKPLTWTSFNVVNKLRYKLKNKKIGHAGTLDPLATGLLILCTGKMTKRIEEFQGQEKEYTGKFIIGQTTPSYDLETEVSEAKDITHLSEENIRQATQKFIGVIDQTPPAHSAIWVNGKRSYDLVREGKEVELKSRQVTVHEFEITRIDKQDVYFRIVCSKGTYIRSLARDFGETLGVGAYLGALCRTRIGQFRLEDAKTIDEIEIELIPDTEE
ncbi:MAG: tRNA pseudouridine(55) synthase TruB [Azospira oryzae]|jgi:tRNA pseudouridine55 synthase|nr:MAG: tRNA pseudouridine(55) synthase TruB [Azospira oryzae]